MMHEICDGETTVTGDEAEVELKKQRLDEELYPAVPSTFSVSVIPETAVEFNIDETEAENETLGVPGYEDAKFVPSMDAWSA